ncbi:mRNA splicing protein PRP45 [Sugiyamaella lignohabitans]|uniref:Pre-mRNA-processing protein 45 n=1 Tax=Sugiyamaella lignohabitans TaxID=796027 RepID=A0A161HNU4_9ASCO|nr:mRNA splicing protein PRP45 [Sugiyamaella lignohabitans]ANB15877.1 mRNA splicing protein PRP45 [Sugiyamaella lignohabitans]
MMSRQSVGSFLPKPKNAEKENPRYAEVVSEDEADASVSKSTSISIRNESVAIVKPKTSTTLALQRNSQGALDYSGVIARQGHDSKRIIQTSYSDLIPLRQRAAEINLEKPTQEQVDLTTERTKAALEKIISGKVESSRPQSVVKKANEPTYVRYTPASAPASGSAPRQRIIKMVDRAEDPLAPPKFKHTKVPGGPPSPPPPVLRSPPRKLTAKDQEDWYIPPSVSNWKNPKGFTIALDKRVAADGRGLQEAVVNDNMAKLAEALYAADRSARDEIRQRAAMQQKLAERENAVKEEKLRQLAQQAREERTKISASSSATRPRDEFRDRSPVRRKRSVSRSDSRSISRSPDRSRSPSYRRRSRSPSRSPDRGEQERARIRSERKKEAERELRKSRMGAERRVKMLARENDRDISERVALGVAKPTRATGESQFDARLFSQTSNSGGLGGSGYSEDQVYDKSLFSAQEAVRSIYRPRGNVDADDGGDAELDRINKEKRFQGLGALKESEGGSEGPVEFVKDTDDDPFGVNQMVDQVKKNTKYGLN